ncbi:class II aldolase/adducin family protein [Candidatus Venteria ishoeyi]|uniref:Short chain dehydrogenase n=1 Tax=Candidatus Venteria ishoeyi TaxID=1899563 RepID=A0A1H6F676_9GAMM|nr:class II aldolase/adducin family protein [Candidatus Venteria ishoeyi]SEH04485.1 short chain dehydrogenase [Candidatus Venteria ishoeyi]
MESLWQDKDAQHYLNDPLQMRVYSSRLLGQDASLVLHGGGNTSVKAQASNLFGDQETVLYVKGSGWDLASIEKAGFAPVRLNTLQRMAQLEQLSDTDMVNEQRAAMLNPNAPNPSVEAILHAIIPFKYVDHTHADAVVALTNTPDSSDLITELYGKRVLIIPYIMPGFELARQVAKITAEIDWSTLDGMILMNHGVFSFSDDAKTSYETMLKLVSIAEDYLQAQQALRIAAQIPEVSNLQQLADIRKAVSELAGRPMLACLDNSAQACGFASLPDVAKIACQGPFNPGSCNTHQKNSHAGHA